jgi:two-component system cell cycle response regulator
MGKVLVIDDDSDFLNMIKLLLSLNSFTVETACSGAEGLEMIDKSDFDLVLSDVMMPGLSGFEVCKNIRSGEKTFELPVILLTAKGEKEDIIEGINLGANDYIIKPFESEVLIAKINALIKLKELQDEIKRKNKMLENLATTDGLTGVFNHRCFYQKLNEEFERAKRYGTDIACVMLDLDFFKHVNDRYGHLVGDRVLIELAKKVFENIRKYDIFARYGGEEFVLLLPHTDEKGAIYEAERIRKSIESHWFPNIEKKGDVTASFGISTFPSAYIEKSEDLVKFADMALYDAKKKGRNRVECYTQMILSEDAG